ncbi:hypothetical protein CRENPOLYSF1_1000010 [Crenothrix polyspora]|uniref:Uncharacterized protein n=1 Tax=Crenothrix polyspora TaxID=360316 RepID=A0A1R4GZ59_9GAMM|nr:hypothetical protein CRENPOLYSF1_1000010 [Crenothrix polyspora]
MIALNMLSKGIDIETISEITGLTEGIVEALFSQEKNNGRLKLWRSYQCHWLKNKNI